MFMSRLFVFVGRTGKIKDAKNIRLGPYDVYFSLRNLGYFTRLIEVNGVRDLSVGCANRGPAQKNGFHYLILVNYAESGSVNN